MNFFGLIISLLPGFIWLLFYLREDLHPEPKKLLVLTFVNGVVFALFALAAEIGVIDLFPSFDIENFKPGGLYSPLVATLAFLVFALIEEIAKFGAAYFTVHKNPALDEPVDAMIYTVVAALGFATLENAGAIHTNANQAAFLAGSFETASLRFVGATLLHSLASALVGYYWAIGIREMSVKKHVTYGLVWAVALHGIFNYFIIIYGNIIYTLVFLVVVGFFVLNDFEKLKRRAL